MILLFSGFISLIIKKNLDSKQSFTNLVLDEDQSNAFYYYFKLFVNYPDAQNSNYNQVYQDPVPFFPENTQVMKGTNRDLNGSDTLLVRYHGNDNNNVFSCLGTPLTTTQITESLFYINTDGKLACSIVQNGSADMKSPNILIEDVEVMHVRYGEDTDHDGVANRYVPANSTDLSYDRVVTVKISLLARTGETINPLLATKYYQLDDIEFGPYTDHHARRVLTFSLPVNTVTKHAP